jgi:hypothetical protein
VFWQDYIFLEVPGWGANPGSSVFRLCTYIPSPYPWFRLHIFHHPIPEPQRLPKD